MSFGALSYEAKTALARGSAMAGSATCSGEGGMILMNEAIHISGIINVFNQDMVLTPIMLNWLTL
jgi:glutamate synthase domain-containing protein 2